MNTRSTRRAVRASRQQVCALAAIAALTFALTGCGADEASPSDAGTTAGTSMSDAPTSPAESPDAASPTQLAASLDWPAGTEDFALNVCVSIGESTIQGAGSSADWNLSFDANLLAPDDTGTMQVARASDSAVEYDADITALAVQADGTFEATGQDAGGAPFRLTGTCTLSW